MSDLRALRPDYGNRGARQSECSSLLLKSERESLGSKQKIYPVMDL